MTAKPTRPTSAVLGAGGGIEGVAGMVVALMCSAQRNAAAARLSALMHRARDFGGAEARRQVLSGVGSAHHGVPLCWSDSIIATSGK